MPRTIALLYARVSLVQDGRETSPAVQIERCYRVAMERGRAVNLETDVYMDASPGTHSAFTRENLPEWDRLEQRARTDPEVAEIIADDVDRQFRNTRALLNFEAEMKRIGVKLVFVSSGEVETDSPTGMLQFTMKGLLAEMHARDTSYRIKTRHYAPLRARGLYLGHGAPPGLKRVGHRFDVRLEAGPNLPIIVAFLKLYLEDHGTPWAAQELERRGLIPSGHWPRWRVTFRRLFAKLDKGYYDGIIDASLLTRAKQEHKRRADEHRRTRKPKRHAPPALWQLMVCHACNQKLTVDVAQYPFDARIYLNYSHPRNACPDRRGISALKAAKQLKAWLANLRTLPDAEIKAAAERMSALPAQETPDAELQIRKLETRLAGLEIMKADGDITRERFRTLKSEIEAEIAELSKRRVETGTGAQWTYEGAYAFLKQLVETDLPGLVDSDPEAANRLLRAILARVVLEPDKCLRFELLPEFGWLEPAPA